MLIELLQVVDRLILLVRGRLDRRKQLFEQVFKGVFDDLLLVHGDYLTMFAAVQKLAIADGSASLENAQDALRDMRIRFAPVRERLQQFAAAFDASSLPPEELAFLHTVIWYFPNGVIARNSTSATQILVAVEELGGLGFLPESVTNHPSDRFQVAV